MGNIPVQNGNNKVKPKKLTKMQVEIACLKVKAHLELVKDRKVNQLMKDQKTLVAMLNAKSRNKVEEVLQAEKVISDLKYIQACTTLMAYANTLKNNCAVIAESQGNPLKLQELVPYIISIIYASTYLGLSSLNEFKNLMLNFFGTENVQLPPEQIDPKIIEAFKVNSTPYELNTYFLEMSERNNIPMEVINAIGHNITRHNTGPAYNAPQVNPNQNNPYNQYQPQQQPQQPQQIYGGNPYRNSVNLEAPQQPAFNQNKNIPNHQNNIPNNNVNQGGNFNYPTEEFNPFNNKGFEFDTKPINVPAYNPQQINKNIAQGFNISPSPAVQPVAPIVPPKLFEADPYANLLNINQIDDIPLYPQMERLSLDPNKNKKIAPPKNDFITLNTNNNVSPGGYAGFGGQYNPTPAFNPSYSPEYVPFNAEYQPPKNIESHVYPNVNDFKDFAKPQVANNFENFSLDQGYNINPNPKNAFDNYNPYGNVNDPGFDKICEQIRKGL